MWWFLKKIVDTDTEIVYSYGRETKEQTGNLKYDKINEKFIVQKIADNDTEKGSQRLLPHLYKIIFDENAPDERLIAIG
jgi:hypothetical protein|nr:MAG TPA: hypothetical protein [Caudoviricetes sp.]